MLMVAGFSCRVAELHNVEQIALSKIGILVLEIGHIDKSPIRYRMGLFPFYGWDGRDIH